MAAPASPFRGMTQFLLRNLEQTNAYWRYPTSIFLISRPRYLGTAWQIYRCADRRIDAVLSATRRHQSSLGACSHRPRCCSATHAPTPATIATLTGRRPVPPPPAPSGRPAIAAFTVIELFPNRHASVMIGLVSDRVSTTTLGITSSVTSVPRARLRRPALAAYALLVPSGIFLLAYRFSKS
jgi:hypothetical protein